jgi:hypothetical protein
MQKEAGRKPGMFQKWEVDCRSTGTKSRHRQATANEYAQNSPIALIK